MVEKLLNDYNLCLLNTGEPTYRHHSHHSFSVPDVSICDQSLALEFDWLTHNDFCGSDHFPVALKIFLRDNEPVAEHWKFDRADCFRTSPVTSLYAKAQEMSLKNRRKKLPRYLFDCHSTDTRLLMWTLAVCNPVWTLAKTCNNPACNSFWTTKLEHWNIQADCLLAISFYHCLRIQRLTWVWLMTPHLRVNLNPL